MKMIPLPKSSDNVVLAEEKIKIDNIYNSSIKLDLDAFNIPKIVLTGTQASGKSSLLNSIIEIDMLLTSQCIAIRTY